MSNYKDYPKVFIGASDCSMLVTVMPERENVASILKFGEDGAYYAYLIPDTATIGENYKLVDSGAHWIKIYDDEALIFHASASSIKIYRSGNFGCIIQVGQNAKILRTYNGTTDNDYLNKKLYQERPLSVKELTELSGRKKSVIYKLAKELGRTPTLLEITERPNGRPKKY